MKRFLLILIAFVFLLVLTSCVSESKQEILMYLNENDNNYIEQKRVSSTKIVEELSSLSMPYSKSTKEAYIKYPINTYTEGKFSYIFDKNDYLVGYSFPFDMVGDDTIYRFPEGFQKKSVFIGNEKAKEISLEFLSNYTDTNGYELVSQNNNPFYRFHYKKCVNGIEIEKAIIGLDKYGNVFMFRITKYANEEVELPNNTNEFYIGKLKAFYMDIESSPNNWKSRNIRETKDYKITYKSLCYLSEFQTYAVMFRMTWINVLNDGSENPTGNQFYYLLNQK
ncbi:MAG: hypothetical protein PHY15_06315 [Eubacteriales bacterium]|nr:hypothetical protein [Eubacteriales bacterium]MDD4474574.1 hypothetical protein [Eubacteriales bacterium]